MKLYSPNITKPTEVNYYWHEKVLVEPMPKPKQGEWISNHDGLWNCSECGLRVFIYAKGNYCPNCGARMKGTDDE